MTTRLKKLHVVNGGYKTNHDKKTLERVARGTREVRTWIVPKHAQIGDPVIINIDKFGLFATAQIASTPRRRYDWKGFRYGARLKQIKLISPPISIPTVQRRIPKWGWALYRRSITTPVNKISDQVLDLVSKRRRTGLPDIDDEALEESSLEELRKVALARAKKTLPLKQREVLTRAASNAIRIYALRRSLGICEACKDPAPFHTEKGEPYLEVHHTTRRTDDGPDHPAHVIALCPNCHRRTEFGADAKVFSASLVRLVARIEAALERV